MELSAEYGALLLLIAAVVAILTRRLHLPYSVGLVAAGTAIALSPWAPHVALTKELLFTLLLPPLIFEGAFYLDWGHLRKDLLVVTILATVGVLFSAAVTAAGMHYAAGWSWITAVVFGILIAATDPVSVIATFKEAQAHGRLLLLIESESLFNDGTAAVFFAIALEYAQGRAATPADLLIRLALTIAGSMVIGAVIAGMALLLAGRTQDHLVEITFTTVAAYASFLAAEHLHLSGVLSTLVAGLMIGNLRTTGAISERGREAVEAFWEYAAFVANSLVFLLIGMREASQNFFAGWKVVLIAIAMVTLGRAAAVYPCCLPFAVSMRHQHVLFWGGLRGALALALALALPQSLPGREAIVTVSFAVVAFSVFVQGLTLTPLLRAFGEIPKHPR